MRICIDITFDSIFAFSVDVESLNLFGAILAHRLTLLVILFLISLPFVSFGEGFGNLPEQILLTFPHDMGHGGRISRVQASRVEGQEF